MDVEVAGAEDAGEVDRVREDCWHFAGGAGFGGPFHERLAKLRGVDVRYAWDGADPWQPA